MSEASVGTFAADHGQWLAYQHNWLDARLAAVFMTIVQGSCPAAAQELKTYRAEYAAHTGGARGRFFPALAGLDARSLAAEDQRWRALTEDVQHAAGAVERCLRHADVGGALATFEVLHRAMRRQWTDEERLLEVADSVARPPVEAGAEAALSPA